MRKAKAKSEDLPEFDDVRILQRPDGIYWQSKRSGEESGPFGSVEDALADLDIGAEWTLEPGETLAEAEDEIGIADWVNPDTGELAEEGVPRNEDH